MLFLERDPKNKSVAVQHRVEAYRGIFDVTLWHRQEERSLPNALTFAFTLNVAHSGKHRAPKCNHIRFYAQCGMGLLN